MQQTKRYKLNQIEPQDHFLPQALAENAQKIEDALLAHGSGWTGRSPPWTSASPCSRR